MKEFYDHLMTGIFEQIRNEVTDSFFKEGYASGTTRKTDEIELKLIHTVPTKPKIGFEDFKIVDLAPIPENGDIIWKAAVDMNAE
jgi:hypothetical protein